MSDDYYEPPKDTPSNPLGSLMVLGGFMAFVFYGSGALSTGSKSSSRLSSSPAPSPAPSYSNYDSASPNNSGNYYSPQPAPQQPAPINRAYPRVEVLSGPENNNGVKLTSVRDGLNEIITTRLFPDFSRWSTGGMEEAILMLNRNIPKFDGLEKSTLEVMRARFVKEFNARVDQEQAQSQKEERQMRQEAYQPRPQPTWQRKEDTRRKAPDVKFPTFNRH